MVHTLHTNGACTMRESKKTRFSDCMYFLGLNEIENSQSDGFHIPIYSLKKYWAPHEFIFYLLFTNRTGDK